MGNCYMGNILDTVRVQDMVLELDMDRLHNQVIPVPPQLTLQENLLQMVRRHIHHIHNHDGDHDVRRDVHRDVHRDARRGVRRDVRRDARDARRGVRRGARRGARHGVLRTYLHSTYFSSP